MLDARIGQQSQPVQPWPQSRVTVCQPEQTNQCFSRSRSKALCPKPSPSSLSFPGNGLSNRLGKRSQDLSKLSEVWHLCWANFYPVNHLPLCLISSECRPPLQNCPPSRTREGQGDQWGLRRGEGRARHSPLSPSVPSEERPGHPHRAALALVSLTDPRVIQGEGGGR